MNLNECKKCKYLYKVTTSNESYYECGSPKYTTSWPEFTGKCPHFEPKGGKNENQIHR